MLLIWGIYFGFFIYKSTYQWALTSYLNNPIALKEEANLPWILSNVKVCYMIDMAISGGAALILKKVTEM